MKKLITLAFLFTINSFAAEVPDYLKDGTITVTLKDGKAYTFSANEYMVVKRESKPFKIPVISLADPKPEIKPAKVEKRLKHIVSGEILRSNGGLNTKTSANQVEVENRKQLGVGLQYQYNLVDDVFVGGRVDSNGGTGLSLGLGF